MEESSPLLSALPRTLVPLVHHKLLKISGLYQLLEMILQYLTLLGSMALIPVVSIVQVLIPLIWVTSHLVRPLEVWLVLNPVCNPMDV